MPVTREIKKRSIDLNGHKTSVSLEDIFWDALEQVAKTKDMTRAELIAEIAAKGTSGNLSSAIRVTLMAYYVDAVENPVDLRPGLNKMLGADITQKP